ncbi:hypothetical protein M9H77_15922 [Catharanthus roseus]|uniref:Uncharacterized protein n=1 Tax=Catharanthus roseus TaxID=4058 RepID=A0ACC0AYV3_CATRO|nr:hypothetical protein M9H77_15922 [Catharanthus roseus]
MEYSIACLQTLLYNSLEQRSSHSCSSHFCILILTILRIQQIRTQMDMNILKRGRGHPRKSSCSSFDDDLENIPEFFKVKKDQEKLQVKKRSRSTKPCSSKKPFKGDLSTRTSSIRESTTTTIRSPFSFSSLPGKVDQRKVACFSPRLKAAYVVVGLPTRMPSWPKSPFTSKGAGSKKTCAKDVFFSALSSPNPKAKGETASLSFGSSFAFPRIAVAGAKPAFFAPRMREKVRGKNLNYAEEKIDEQIEEEGENPYFIASLHRKSKRTLRPGYCKGLLYVTVDELCLSLRVVMVIQFASTCEQLNEVSLQTRTVNWRFILPLVIKVALNAKKDQFNYNSQKEVPGTLLSNSKGPKSENLFKGHEFSCQNLSRDDFIMKLRLIVGDQFLKSTVIILQGKT